MKYFKKLLVLFFLLVSKLFFVQSDTCLYYKRFSGNNFAKDYELKCNPYQYIGTSDFYNLSCLNSFIWLASTPQCHRNEFVALNGWSQASSFMTNFCNERIFGGLNKLYGTMSLTKTFDVLPPHTKVIIEFNILKINTWNGEIFEIKIDKISQFNKSLSFNDDSFVLCPDIADFGKIEPIKIEVGHTSPSLDIQMQGYLAGFQGNLYWGIKDFKVYIINNCTGGCLTCLPMDGSTCLSCPIFSKLINGKCNCAKHFFLKTSDFVHCAICHYSCYSCNGPLETNCSTCFLDHVLSDGKCVPYANNTNLFLIKQSIELLDQKSANSWNHTYCNVDDWDSECGWELVHGGAGRFGKHCKISKNYVFDLPHYKAGVRFDLYLMDSWDKEVINLKIDSKIDPVISLNIYDNYNDYGNFGGIGYNDFFNVAYKVFDHESNTLGVEISDNLDSDPCDESWGISNFQLFFYICHSSCLTCSGPLSTDCKTCYNGAKLNDVSECKCEGNYYMFINSSECLNVPCSSCVSSCQDGLYGDTDTKLCSSCDSSCLTCNGGLSTQCAKCHKGLFLTAVGTCETICPSPDWGDLESNTCVPMCLQEHQYGDINDSRKCNECNVRCKKCVETALSCTSCDDGLYLSNSICYATCPLGQYAVYQNKKCEVDCPQNQFKNEENRICERICPKNLYANKITGKCTPSCPYGTYPNILSKECTLCHASCYTCSGPLNTNCVSCYPFAILESGKCNCDITYFSVTKSLCNTPQSCFECKKCSLGCAKCEGSLSTECKSCIEDFFLTDLNSCVKECTSPTWRNDDEQKCSSSCPPSKQFGDNFDSRRCKSICPSPLYGVITTKTCEYDCPDQFFKHDINRLCYSICPSSYFADPLSLKCVQICPIGFYGNANTHRCISCSENCLECNNDITCNLCKTETILHEGKCILECPSYYYNSDGKCEKCQENCVSCINSTRCKQCEKSFVLNQITQTCIICSDDNVDCLSCKPNEYFYNKSCVDKCPQNYFNNDLNQNCTLCNISMANCSKCSSKNLCLGCYFPFLLNSSTCIRTCNEKEYYNVIDSTCSVCHKNCSNCFGPESKNCLTCQIGRVLKGSECILIEIPQDPEQEKMKVSLRQSQTNHQQFYITFSNEVFLPNYFNLDAMISLNIKNAPNNSYTYNVTRTEKNDEFLISMNFKESCLDPIIEVNLTDIAKNYILSQFNSNVTIQTLNESSKFLNISISSVIVPTENKEQIETNKKITSNTFEGLGSTMIIMLALCYLMNIKRMSFFWYFCDSMQTISFFMFCQYNYTSLFSSFFEKLFLYHASFIVFIGRHFDESKGTMLYFGHLFTDEIEKTNFYKYFGTNSFMVNGFQAFAAVILAILIGLFFKLIVFLFNRFCYEIDDDDNLFIAFIRYIDENCMISFIARISSFFFNIVILSAIAQLSNVSTKTTFDLFSLFFTIIAFLYYLVFFLYASRKIINNQEIYEDEEQLNRYECFFSGLSRENLFKRNHFLIIHLKKFFIILVLFVNLKNPKIYSVYLIIMEIGLMLYFILVRPFKTMTLNVLNFLTELLVFVIVCIFFKFNSINFDKMDAENIKNIENLTNILIALVFVLLGMYFAISSILFAYYCIQNIECICYMFFSNGKEIEALKEFDERSNSIAKDDNFKIPRKKVFGSKDSQ